MYNNTYNMLYNIIYIHHMIFVPYIPTTCCDEVFFRGQHAHGDHQDRLGSADASSEAYSRRQHPFWVVNIWRFQWGIPQ